jgi:GNAT superfamily N-acetyltransferase
VTPGRLTPPIPITEAHALEAFDSGEPALDDWLKRRALRNNRSGASRTYVVCEGRTVIGYYCLSAGGVGHAEAPKALRRNMPDPIPVLVIGRLAIHKDHHNRGLGSALLRDAALRALEASRIAGVAALLVHALSEPAKRFYLSRGFAESPVQPMTLCLPLAMAEKALGDEM